MKSNPYDLGNFLLTYQYYSSFALCITWILAPLTFYIILTQSKSLGPIKWLFLNHSFWCLILETTIGIIKPVVLGDVAAGYNIGLLKNTGFQSSAITALLCLLFVFFSVGGLFMTIQNRYATIFDINILEKLSKGTNLLIAAIVIYVSMTLISCISVLPIFFIEVDQVHKWAKEYDTNLVLLFNQSTFFFIPHEMINVIVMISLILIILFAILCIVSGVMFIFYFRYMEIKTTRNKKIQKSVSLSALVQIFLTIFFLFIPVIIFFFNIEFKIRNSGKWMQVLMCVVTSHCFLDYIATLYFVLPYRRFLVNMISWIRTNRLFFSNSSGN